MVLLSLGSGLITALMAQAKPPRQALDLNWVAEYGPATDPRDEEDAVMTSDKTVLSQ